MSPLTRDPNCTLCKLHKTAEYVCLLGQGPKQCDVMIVGEAPGQREDASGKPFVGRSGQLLEEVLAEYGFSRSNVFITNAVSCRPPDNRTPTKVEVRTCKVWLDRQIASVKPKFVLLLGNTPLLSLTGSTGIKKARGKPFEQDGITFLPTYHPAYILREPGMRDLFERDIKLFQTIVNGGGIAREENLDIVIVDTKAKFKDLLRDLCGTISFDIETTCLYPWGEPNIKKDKKTKKKVVTGFIEPHITSIGFGTAKYQYIIPAHHEESPWTPTQLQDMVEEITEKLDDCFVVMQGGKFDCLWMWVYFDVQWQDNLDFDTMLAHYILDENDNHGLKYLAQKYCGAPDWEIDIDTKQGKNTFAKLSTYHAHDLYYTRELRFVLGKMLAQDYEVRRVFERIMMPCARLFTEVEYDGVCLDTSKMGEAEKYLNNEVAVAEKAMSGWAIAFERANAEDYQKESFNWGSPKQLGALLFGSKKQGGLGIAPLDKTPTGTASTSESVIKRIEHPIGGDILKLRGARQQLSFFIEGWRPYMTKLRGSTFLHPSFKLHGTVTGRLSCEHPNLQQVPRDVRIRQLIISEPGWTLVEVDLSQIELRIAAELAQERTMMEAFRTGVDVHWLTAMKELERGGGGEHVETIIRTAQAWLLKQGKKTKLRFPEAMEIVRDMGPTMAEDLQKIWKEDDPRKLWKEIRKKAKAVNFGYLYGMWWKKFKLYARDNYGVIVDDEGAQNSRKDFFELFRDFPKWHDKQRRFARMNGYVRSLSGRKRRLPAAQSLDDGFERQEAERQAINSPVQSFANEINLMAAIQLRKEYGRDIVRICGTVHDSILARVKNEYVDEVVTRLLKIMERPALFDLFDIKLSVPVMAEAKVGAWGASISFERWQGQNKARRKVTRNDSSTRHRVGNSERETRASRSGSDHLGSVRVRR